ncbi:MAG: TolC family protein, partial [Melioribacteraceae bacterium]|nr:TolC family protein [Melioribacteraceae bacterium]
MKKQLIIIVSIFLITLSSCSFGPDFQKPTVETPDSFMYDSLKVDSLTNLKWWDLFEDPVLDTLIVTSLRQNRDLRIAASRIVEARAALGFTKADQYPKIDITAGATRGNYFNGIQLSDENSNFYVAAPLSWEIDFWGKFRRATESSRAQLMASEYSLRT